MARQTSKTTTGQIATLARVNEQLKTENAELRSELQGHHDVAQGWRLFFITLFVALATLLLVAGNALFWAGDTLVNNDRYVKTVTPLLQDSAIQAAVADYTTAQLFKNVDVDQVIENALPPPAAFLAAPLTTQLQHGTEQVLRQAIASDKFQTIWANTNSKAHQRFITALKQSRGNGVIDLQTVYDRLADNLQGTKLSFLARRALPANVGSIEVVRARWLPTARNIVNNIGWIKPVVLLGVALCSAAALWLARNRRKLVIVLGGCFTAGMLVSLIAVRVISSNIVSDTVPVYQTAAGHAAHIVTRSLVTQTVTVLLISLLIALIAWLTGPYKLAAAGRQRLNWLLSGQLHQALFGRHESAMTRWIAAYKHLLQWSAVAIMGIIMLLVQLTPKTVLFYALSAALIVLIIEILAAPPTSRRSKR